MNADGSGQTPLTGGDDKNEWGYEWSPDGSRILYIGRECASCDRDVHSMNPDGTDRRNLTDHPASDRAAHWSRDGEQIHFLTTRGGYTGAFYTMNPDGSRQAYLYTLHE